MWRGRVAYQSRPGARLLKRARRIAVAVATLVLIGLGMSGCGQFRGEQREPWRLQAEEACLASKQVKITSAIVSSSPVDGPGACGISHPFKVSAFADGSVALKTRATLGCPMIPKTDLWLAEVVQPAALALFGVEVIEIRSGSYACRGRNNQRGAKLSEHAFGNALDIMGFKLADGREISIIKGWKGAQDEQDFLREAFVGACRHFTTVLGPGADAFHYDHFHLDLARHDPRRQRRICKPVIKYTPMAERGGGMSQPGSYPNMPVYKGAPSPGYPPAGGMDNQQMDEIDPETDPFAVEDAADAARLSRGGPSRIAAPTPQAMPVPQRNERAFAEPQFAVPVQTLPLKTAPVYAGPAQASTMAQPEQNLLPRKGDRLDRAPAAAPAIQNMARQNSMTDIARTPLPGRAPEPSSRPMPVSRQPETPRERELAPAYGYLRPPGAVAQPHRGDIPAPSPMPQPAVRPLDLSPPGLIRGGSGLY